MSLQFTGDGLVGHGLTFQTLLSVAYNVDPAQVTGAPKWAESQNFSLQAKVSTEEIAEWGKLTAEQSRLAIRTLLETNFKLTTHWEQKTASVLDLTLVQGDSAKLNRLKDEEAKSDKPSMLTSSGRIEFNHASLDVLCTVLSNQLERKVVNKTNLDGNFRFLLQFEPEGLGKADDGAGSFPTIYTVLREKLGLQLVQRKEIVPNLIIDHVELPQVN